MNNYLTFSSAEPFTINVHNETKNWDGTLYYSTDAFANDDNEWNGELIESAEHNGEHRIYMRGSRNSVITGGGSGSRWVLEGSNIACQGNIENLLCYETVMRGEHPVMGEECYEYMFYNCTALTNAPELPAKTLTKNCYAYMFQLCTSLTTAPELHHATTLAKMCYLSMFRSCTGLTTAPELPDTTLAENCYEYMFYGCESLTTAPSLEATTLEKNCYTRMFSNCTSLTIAPELPADTLKQECYAYMFDGCTSLTTAPELPATTLAKSCYNSMFYGCTGLTTAPELPATTLERRCYYRMFYGCANIKLSTAETEGYQLVYRIPTTGTGTTATDALTDMFTGTGGTFTGTPEINTTYYVAWVAEEPGGTVNPPNPTAMLMGYMVGQAI